ncbi:MAG: biotin--[acetyl-CoA-carboxylase] ligase [Proteobacteria bacterium]|nr:biotin--[acetyl-CoA-carboxylase] ligase [Pseudomonadota bacterium]
MTHAPGPATGFNVVALDAVGSTNDEARRLARQGAPAGTVVLARRQTAGRGRRGRSWESPPGNLYASILVVPGMPASRTAEASFAAALAVAETVERFAPPGLGVECKWPNDVLLGGAKVAGILLEGEGIEERGGTAWFRWLVLGIGVNILHFPALAGYRATSLAAAGGETPAPEAMLAPLLAALERWLHLWREEGFAPIRAAWQGRASGLGGPIEFRTGEATLRGAFVGIDAAGALVLRLADGGERKLSAGEVFFG